MVHTESGDRAGDRSVLNVEIRQAHILTDRAGHLTHIYRSTRRRKGTGGAGGEEKRREERRGEERRGEEGRGEER